MSASPEFIGFPKIPRLKRDCVVTEKIDGTNACIVIDGDKFYTQSRNRIITPEDDNYGFAKWAYANRDELVAGLGDGRHYGEWWGAGIQRRYEMDHKRFSLFNVGRWNPLNTPSICHAVPILYQGDFDMARINGAMMFLGTVGSRAAPGFMNPEGIVIYHSASRTMFKHTFEHDASGKEAAA